MKSEHGHVGLETPKNYFSTLLKTAVDRALRGSTVTPKQRQETENYFEEPLRNYLELKLKLPIEDEPMRRICQVLTDAGFTTIESCDGHAKKSPEIFFKCEDQTALRRLAHTIRSQTSFKSRPWQITLYSGGDPYLNPDNPLMFIIEPENGLQAKELIEKRKDLLQDLDLIGLGIYIEFFESGDQVV